MNGKEISGFQGNMAFHPPFHENLAYMSSYRPYYIEQSVVIIPNDPVATEFQHFYHASHPPTLAQYQCCPTYTQIQPQELISTQKQYASFNNQPQNANKGVSNIDKILLDFQRQMDDIKRARFCCVGGKACLSSLYSTSTGYGGARV